MLATCTSPATISPCLFRYISWIRRNKDHQKEVWLDLNEREAELREHPAFEEAHEDDLAAIGAFRKALGVKDDEVDDASPRSVAHSERIGSDDSLGEDTSARNVGMSPSPSSELTSNFRRRLSRGSSVGSVRSMLSSAQHSLSPLPEEEDDDDTMSSSSSSSPKGRSRGSLGRSRTMSKIGKLRSTIEEGSEEGESEDESLA